MTPDNNKVWRLVAQIKADIRELEGLLQAPEKPKRKTKKDELHAQLEENIDNGKWGKIKM